MISRITGADVRALVAKPEPPKKKNKPRAGTGSLKKAIDDVRDRFSVAKQTSAPISWQGGDHRMLVGLFVVMHVDVYDANMEDIIDEVAPEWMPACSSARRFLEKSLSGNLTEAVKVMRWSWAREKRKLGSGTEREWRMGWRYQFSLKLLNDYRHSQHR